jgi:subtilase family serine protease
MGKVRNTRSSSWSVLVAVLCGVSTLAAAEQRSVTLKVDENSLTQLHGHVSRAARPEFDRGRVPDSLPQEHILMMLRRSGPKERELQQFIGRQYDPHSPDFHRWLTPQQFGERFGPSTQDIGKVTQWLTQHGFRLNNVPASGLFVDFSGTAGQVAQAFHTEIHHYRINGQDHYANASDPYIPSALAPVVSGFRALNDFHPRPLLRRPGTAHLDRTTGKWSRESAVGSHLTSGTYPFFIAGPQDFATIYSIKQVWNEGVVGTGETIAVVGTTNIESADIQTFRDEFGITPLGPHGSVQMENPPSTVCAAPDPSDNSAESYLDAEWAGATAPDATVDYVACGQQGVTFGADLAAAYIIGDPAHVQRVSVLSTSWGDCEALPQSQASQFYVSLWQQAAVEGITVVVAAGDTGGDGCQYVSTDATDGLSLDNEASTPYNIAAGGTNFSDVFSETSATYWSAANGANYQSAQSYIPETTWNDSCASPLVLARFGQGFTDGFGPNGFCTYAAQQPVDPNTGYPPYFLPYAGSGGLSTVSARPAWQTGVPGIPPQGGRAVPDISMFAGGYTWGEALIICDSALAGMPAGTACDFSNANDVNANWGGGTSLVAPAFAGIMALIDQKSGDRQGQANYVLYKLAAEQYVSYGSSTQPSLANCAAYLGPQVLSGCYFHDVSATPNHGASPSTPFLTGNTSIPCNGSATSPGTFTDTSTDPASNDENCYGYQIAVTGNGTTLTTTPDYYGVLSAAQNATSPAWPATPGYDLATGLGSPNVYSLVNAPQWAGGLTTAVQLSPQRASITAIESVNLVATVTDQDNVPVLGGTVTFYSGNTVLGAETQECAPGGVFSLQVTGATLGPLGAYGNIFASFTGGTQQCQQKTATYYGGQSSPSTVEVCLEWLGENASRLRPRVPRPPGSSR